MELPIPSYGAFRNDTDDPEERGKWYVNEYRPWKGRKLATRTTLYDGLTETEAVEIVAFLERFAARRAV